MGKITKGGTAVVELLDNPRFRTRIERALPEHLSTERLLASVFGELRRTPKLAHCNKASFFNAVLQASQAGLEIGGPLGHGYLIPFKKEVVFVPGYRGLLFLARQSGEILDVRTGVVCEGDHFVYRDGLELRLEHTPHAAPTTAKLERAWAIVTTKTGGQYVAVLWKEEIDKIRSGSAGRNAGAWTNFYLEMAKKTALRRALKVAPMSARLARVVADDEAADAGVLGRVELEPEDAEIVDVAELQADAQPDTAAELADAMEMADELEAEDPSNEQDA